MKLIGIESNLIDACSMLQQVDTLTVAAHFRIVDGFEEVVVDLLDVMLEKHEALIVDSDNTDE